MFNMSCRIINEFGVQIYGVMIGDIWVGLVRVVFDQFGLGVIYCGFVDLYFEFVNYFMVYVGYIFFGLG